MSLLKPTDGSYGDAKVILTITLTMEASLGYRELRTFDLVKELGRLILVAGSSAGLLYYSYVSGRDGQSLSDAGRSGIEALSIQSVPEWVTSTTPHYGLDSNGNGRADVYMFDRNRDLVFETAEMFRDWNEDGYIDGPYEGPGYTLSVTSDYSKIADGVVLLEGRLQDLGREIRADLRSIDHRLEDLEERLKRGGQ